MPLPGGAAPLSARPDSLDAPRVIFTFTRQKCYAPGRDANLLFAKEPRWPNRTNRPPSSQD